MNNYFRQERQQKIVAAEGEAAAAKMMGEAMIQSPGYLKLRKLAASKKISSTIAQSQNRVYLNAGSLMLDVASPTFDSNIETIIKAKQ